MTDNDDWPFDQAPNVAALTTVGVIETQLPILVVQHFDDDHSWSFLCGTTEDVDDGRVISMESIVDLDPSVRMIADLAPGGIARRDSVDDPWVRQ